MSKMKSNQTTNPRKIAKREATRHNMINYTERTRGNDLALSTDVQSLGQEKCKWWLANHELKS
jgi:hypothetical protein